MKGISPLIAAVLLIAFTITIAILIVSWGTSFTTTATSGISNKSSELVECSGAAIEIDSVYVSGNSISVIVMNSGVRAVTITNMLVTNITGGTNTSTVNSVLGRGNVVSLNVSGVTCTSFSKVLVATSCPGISAEWTKSPTCG
jgi:flagellin-like protein